MHFHLQYEIFFLNSSNLLSVLLAIAINLELSILLNSLAKFKEALPNPIRPHLIILFIKYKNKLIRILHEFYEN